MSEEKKDCMFQYATKFKIYEDTKLITKHEAIELWNKYLPDVMDRWNDIESPEMCIWIDCESDTDYHTQVLDIDYRDCELSNGAFYRVIKEKIDIDKFSLKEQQNDK